ncbi:MAG TPA: hypothetical protein VEH09_13040 [Thermodesulfobacteriota bacterium]|nr:hypothetical protein [Thermodesulfobacteriota bacterium]
MKRILAPIVVLATFLLLMGMGGVGGPAEVGKIPAPEKNFNVRVTDQKGVQTSLSQFSQEGKVFLVGKRGDATVSIPFEKITQIQFEASEGKDKDVEAKVSLRGLETGDIRMEKQAKFYGKADFGTFEILAKDLKSISFLP